MAAFRLALAALAAGLASCGPFWTPIEPDCEIAPVARASSLPYLGIAGSTRRVERPGPDTLRELVELFDKRGYHLRADHPAGDGSHDVLHEFASRAANLVLGFELGSAFFAVVRAIGPAHTEVFVLGKPLAPDVQPDTATEVCSDADPVLQRFGYRCADVRSWIPLAGRAEADVVRGVLAELGEWAARPGPAAARGERPVIGPVTPGVAAVY